MMISDIELGGIPGTALKVSGAGRGSGFQHRKPRLVFLLDRL
jgi:hypothetical protein